VVEKEVYRTLSTEGQKEEENVVGDEAWENDFGWFGNSREILTMFQEGTHQRPVHFVSP
jgi:hypothetical protein